MGQNLAQKLVASHLRGSYDTAAPAPGAEIALAIDQTLTQDATGTLVMLELEGMNLDRTRAEISVQYVDHNLIQADHKNPDDHVFLHSACERFGIWYSGPGNGVSHAVHMERFGRPGKTLLGADSHSCAAGALGMLAIGAGGLDVAMAIAGEPFYLRMPKIGGIELRGALADWVSAKDVILELLRRHGVKGALGSILEYHGPGLDALSAMDRHVIANMGAELGATASVFPADVEVRRFLRAQQREGEFEPLEADPGADYDWHDTVDLGAVEPMIAMPSSPDNVVPVREVEGEPIYQAYVGSSANPGYRDFAVAAALVRDRQVATSVSFDVNPTSRQILENLARDGHLGALIRAGARLHQAGCNGCIGMGQAPATHAISLRTVPRNFPGRSGTREDKVCLVSPETAAASALTGRITDPRKLDRPAPRIHEPDNPIINRTMIAAPPPPEEGKRRPLITGPNIAPFPELDPLPDDLELPVLLAVGDNVSTDEILPAGARVLPLRSNIPAIAEFAFEAFDEAYPRRARAALKGSGGHIVVGGDNYGQGSSREHAALAPRYLGLRAVIVRSFARIHAQNLINFGVLPLTFIDPADADNARPDETLALEDLHRALHEGSPLPVRNRSRNLTFDVAHALSARQIEIMRRGGLVPWMRERL